MKTYALIFVHVACAFALFSFGCNKNNPNAKLPGTWKAKDGSTGLKITGKEFILGSDAAEAEDYFVKGDTIFTSFEGNQPYTRFVIQKLDEKELSLMFPDSVTVEFVR